MTEKTRRTRGPGRPVERLFITRGEIARSMGLGNPATIDSWIAAGSWPPPHSRPSERYAVWLRRHWQAYVDSGEWPREAWRRPGA